MQPFLTAFYSAFKNLRVGDSFAVSPLPNSTRRLAKPVVHHAPRQFEHEFPVPQLPIAQTRAAPMNQPRPQFRVRHPSPQPAQGVPVTNGEDASDDEVAVCGPAQAGEVVVPEEGAEAAREAI